MRVLWGYSQGMASTEEIEAVVQRWEDALSAHDAEALATCYAPDATLESPVALHLVGKGVCHGRDELKALFDVVVKRTPELRQYHRAGFHTDGHRVTWEYPRDAPDGDQMDFVEVMEIEDGLIKAHRVYWGWRGVEIILGDNYHRDGD